MATSMENFFLKHRISWVPYFHTNPSQPRVGCTGNLTPETMVTHGYGPFEVVTWILES